MRFYRKSIACLIVLLLLSAALGAVWAEETLPPQQEQGDGSTPGTEITPTPTIEPEMTASSESSTEEPTSELTEAPTYTPSLEPTTEPTVTPAGATVLRIDSEHLYDGMAMTYAQGYAPVPENGRVKLVLPLVCEGRLRGDSLMASLDLGNPGSSPFVFGNYQQIVPLSAESVQDGSVVQTGYFVRFDLALAMGRTNGTYAVTVRIEAMDEQGNPIEQHHTLYVTISDGKNPSSGYSGGGGPTASKPVLVVTECLLDKDSVKSGESIHVDVAVSNVGKRSANNIRVTLLSDDRNILLQNEYATPYVQLLNTEESCSFVFDLNILPLAMGGMHSIQIQLKYEGPDNSSYQETAVFRFRVEQESALRFEAPRLPESVLSGESFSLPLSVYNPGLSTVYNVKIAMDADGLLSAAAYLGNLSPQQSADKVMDVFATALRGSNKYGVGYGSFAVSYEDEQGREFLEYSDFSYELRESPKITDTEKEKLEAEAKEQKTLSQWWVSLLIGLAIIAVLVSAILISKFSRMMKMK